MSNAEVLSVKQLAHLNAQSGRWPHTERALRHLIFHAEENGFAECIRRIGRRVLIDIDKYRAWIEAHDHQGRRLGKLPEA